MPPTQHAVLGASGSHRWIPCPGSIRMADGRSSPTNEYMILGSAAHELAEQMLLSGEAAESMLGSEIAVDREDEGVYLVLVDQDMVDAVQVYLDHVRERTSGQGLIGHEVDWWVERKVDLMPLDPPGPMFGTVDALIWHEDEQTIEIIDYKHGEGVAVDAVDNTQLLYYALGAAVELNRIPETVRMTIVQPRGFHPAGPIRTAEITWEELKAFKSKLFAAAERTQQEDAPLVPGDHCRFCVAKATCPARKEHAVEIARAEFGEVDPTGKAPKPEELTPEEIAQVLDAKDAIMDWLKAIEEHATEGMDKGSLEVPGYKLVAGRRGHRKWVDSDAADTYLRGQGLKVDERYEPRSLLSPTRAEKALKDHNGKTLPDRLVSQSEGKPRLAQEGDARPALEPSAQRDFEAIPPAESD